MKILEQPKNFIGRPNENLFLLDFHWANPMKLNENAMKLTNENNFTGNEFRHSMIPYGKGYEKAMKFGVPNEILTFHGFSLLISLAFIGYPSSSACSITVRSMQLSAVAGPGLKLS